MLTYTNQTAVSTRELAWDAHSQSERLLGESMSAHEALERGGLLGWNVRAIKLTTTGEPKDGTPADRNADDMGVSIRGRYGMIRNTPSGPIDLGVTGERYQIHQNEETVEFLDAIVDEGGANWQAVGYFGDGQRTFAVMKMPQGVTVGGQDAHDFYLACGNSFDGSGKFNVWTTMLRLRCTNMLDASFRGAASRWGVRHTGDLKGKIAAARQSLKLSWKWAEEFQTEADAFLAQPFSEGDFRVMVNRLEPPSDSAHKGWQERQELKRSTLEHLFTVADTNEFGRGTKWGAYNAFTEYADWFQPVKGRDESGTLRATRQLEGASASFKQAAWDYLLVA
jgi:phage/plasmid-like protein (TIGR03299 family)